MTAAENITRNGYLSSFPRESPGKTALLDHGGEEWTYAHVGAALDSPHSLGLSGRVGVLIKDRLLSGLVSCAVMRQATCVPLDPKLTRPEVEAHIELLGIRTVVSDDPAWRSPAGTSVVRVEVSGKELNWSGEVVAGQPSNDALVLMTSGSTGRPKIVSLSHANLAHSAHAIIASLALSDRDRAVNLLPMVHIGGLLDLFLVPLVSGGSVVFGEPRSPEEVLALLSSARPTWLQAAPAILRGLVQSARPGPSHRLRFIRSVSAPLPPALNEQAIRVFGVPVIEMYGMSETAGVITSNPLPPQEQKAGSVGKPVACEVESRGDGEIWVRSAGLFSGYQDRGDNAGLWDSDWFATGDRGYFDEEGFLFLTGRIKELINRGGQKISPAEIDQVVESWPEVEEAAAFGFPHSSLGEEVGLALVFRKDRGLSDAQIRDRLSGSLADYKRPKRILLLDQLPRNQSGKIQRFRLANLSPEEKTGALPLSATARRILPLWQAALGQDQIDDQLDFFDQGGDSLSATTLLVSVEKNFKISLSGFIFYENATVRGLAAAVEERTGGRGGEPRRNPDFPPRIQRKLRRFLSSWPGTAPFKGSYARRDDQAAPKTPLLFWCGNGIGEVRDIAENTRDFLTVVGLRSLRSIQHKKLRNYNLLTSVYCEEVERIQPDGPLHLGGFCEGGRIMVRVGQELIRRGREVQLLILQDYNLEAPFPARIAMIHSQKWKRHPVKHHHDIRQGWQKIFAGHFAAMEKEGNHSHRFTERDQKKLRKFLKEQLARTGSTAIAPPARQAPQCAVTLISKLPRILRPHQSYRVRVRVENKSGTHLVAKDGLVLHARWFDLNRDPKPGIPMFTPLPCDLPPGESGELEIDLISHKGKRLYQLQVALLEEGWGWSPEVLQNSHRHWHLIL